MAESILMPKWGLTMEEGTLISWEVEVGAEIEVGDVMGIVETKRWRWIWSRRWRER